MEVGKGLMRIDHSVSPSSLGVGGGGAHCIDHSAPSSMGVGGGDGQLDFVEGDRGCK